MTFENITDKKTIEWLLERDNPSDRYFTLTKLLNRCDTDAEVFEAKNEIMKIGVIPKILYKQHEDGYWGDAKRFYLDKYTGSVWQLLILAELGADPANVQIKNACHFILENSQDDESYGFSVNKSGKSSGGRHSEVIPCLTGNMVYSLVKLGFLEDVRVKNGIDWICKYQRSDDGVEEKPKGWPYDRFEMCWGKHTCHLGVVKSLKALAAIPDAKRNKSVKETIERLAEYILIHHIHKKSHEINKISKPGWLKLGFPLMYQTDILEILEIFCELGYNDPRMNEAVETLISKKDKDGKWKLENSFNGKMVENIEAKGKISKWITLKALNVLKHLD